jgi:uncharacterized protein (DUF433 family)
MTGKTGNLIGIGLYTVPEASRLTRIPTARLRRWIRGYAFKVGGQVRHMGPVWAGQFPTDDEALALGFLDLIEARFVNAFLNYGVSLNTVRLAGERARDLFHKDHPFATRRFRTDGQRIFAEIGEADGRDDPKLLDLIRSQFEFHSVVSPSLYAGLDFADDDSVLRWYPQHPKKTVVLDPQRAFGRPILRHEGVPTEILAKAVCVEKSPERVAKWYGVPVSAVRKAVAFESAFVA